MPKTGGTSVYNAFKDQPSFRRFGHQTAEKVKTKLGEDVWYNDCFKWCFVRNVYDRFVSLYYFRKQVLECPDAIDLNFNEWIKSSVELNNPLRMSQFYYMKTNNKIELDFVGRFENFQSDFDVVCEKLKIKLSVNIDNVTDHKHYSEYYDVETVELFKKCCKEEIDYFGFEFQKLCWY